MKDFVLLQLMKLMPTHAISRFIGSLAQRPVSRQFIPLFSRVFQIPVEEAEKSTMEYGTLNEFFTRKLREGLRPIATSPYAVVSPADGRIAAFGEIKEGQLIQAKGVTYTVWNLLGMKESEASAFEGGRFMTIYLSPRDYHRVHAPVEGQITDYSYIPGTLFPVNAFGVRAVKGLFAMNERLITFIQSSAGRVGVVKVGATVVGSVKVGYSKEAGTNIKAGTLVQRQLPSAIPVERGGELGFFEFGSTVVLVFEKGKVEFEDRIHEGLAVKMGEQIGQLNK
ncbi:archaetidylserine decarboxylase [Ammoniphilus sp. CFH 90114]|uniref:archaetidylserine decarboxylase n=1 Tax=Ammoniphilus sp. CFH 90114 TaxID=2493665 RepID=UPI00100E5372|nr:archaetidylserine decarboxylase [Ammoniphilus sp. CFH 90114]RXT08109.1 phosphatidylserine decarboxylase [Ammoniphilus sp. CFH 90114]